MTKTKRLAYISLLGALSFLLMLFSFPLIPGADFLKVELSVLPVLIGLMLFDLKTAYGILLLRTVLKFLLNNHGVNDAIGLPMNVLALGIFVTCFALFWKKQPKLQTLILASGLGTLSLTAVMLVLNWVYAMPLYATFANFDIAKLIGAKIYLLSMVLPFNLLQGLIFSFSFAILWLAMRHHLERSSHGK